jgi:hypothetical protein
VKPGGCVAVLAWARKPCPNEASGPDGFCDECRAELVDEDGGGAMERLAERLTTSGGPLADLPFSLTPEAPRRRGHQMALFNGGSDESQDPDA